MIPASIVGFHALSTLPLPLCFGRSFRAAVRLCRRSGRRAEARSGRRRVARVVGEFRRPGGRLAGRGLVAGLRRGPARHAELCAAPLRMRAFGGAGRGAGRAVPPPVGPCRPRAVHHRRLRRHRNSALHATHHLSQFVIYYLDNLLCRIQTFQYILPNCPNFHAGHEIFDYFEVYVRFQQCQPDFTQTFIDIRLGQTSSSSQILDNSLQTIS